MEYKEKTIKQFDKWSETYDEDLWSKYFRRSNLKIFQLLKTMLKKNSDILDIGAGTGQLIKHLSSYFEGEIYGIDISPEMVASCRKNNKGVKNVHFICSDISDLKLEKKFDAIVCMNSFHHYQKPEEVFRFISTHLREQGVFILLDPFRNNIIRKFWTILLKIIFKEGDVKYYTRKELKKFALSSGLRIVSQESFMYLTLITIFGTEGIID